jgi:hypothetical protein
MLCHGDERAVFTDFIMAGLVPAIHVFLAAKTWMPATIGERSDAVLRTAMRGHDGARCSR